jgi:uncharacterized membrane protein required for colicin V production
MNVSEDADQVPLARLKYANLSDTMQTLQPRFLSKTRRGPCPSQPQLAAVGMCIAFPSPVAFESRLPRRESTYEIQTCQLGFRSPVFPTSGLCYGSSCARPQPRSGGWGRNCRSRRGLSRLRWKLPAATSKVIRMLLVVDRGRKTSRNRKSHRGQVVYWLDFVLLALLALGGGLGFYSGFCRQIGRVLAPAIALLITVVCNESASFYFREQLLREADPNIVQGAAYLALFVGGYLVLSLAFKLLYQWRRAANLEIVDGLLGGVFGAGKMAIILGACCMAVENYPHPLTRGWTTKPSLALSFAQGMEAVLTLIPEEYPEILRANLVKLRDLLRRASEPAPAISKDGRSQAEQGIAESRPF